MKVSDWISVENELPSFGIEVIVCCQDKVDQWIEYAQLIQDKFGELIWLDAFGGRLTSVTHWQEPVYPKIGEL